VIVVVVVVVVVVFVFSRWLLVLFSRDFQHVDDVIKLWDGLFADGLDLDLIDYVFIAVLLFLKDDRAYFLAAVLRYSCSQCVTIQYKKSLTFDITLLSVETFLQV